MTSRQAAYDKRRRTSGWQRIPVWLDPETQGALARYRARFPDLPAQEVIRQAIQCLDYAP